MNGVSNLSLVNNSKVGEIAFIDLKAQQKRIRQRLEARLTNVLDHGRYINGPEIEEFESALAAHIGADEVVACASGTAALIAPLLAFDLQAGDAVFLPSFTYNATANAVILAGGTPVFVDIDRTTFNMCPKDLERRLKAVKDAGELRPRIILPVDLFGSPADYPSFEKIAVREGLDLLADGAQGFGGQLNGQKIGNIAPATALSFFPGKALGAYGEAGAIVAKNNGDADHWRSIRWHGTDDARKNSVRVGFNGRMDSFQAGILIEKLAIANEELERRLEVAAYYEGRLSQIAQLQRHIDGARSGHNYYSLCVPERDQVAGKLNEMGVPTAIYYATPLHQMAAFQKYAANVELIETQKVSKEILSLPMHPYLTNVQLEYICDCFEAALA